MFCRNCGRQLHESATFCPHCGMSFAPQVPVDTRSASVWMAVTSLVLSILTLLVILGVASDLDAMNALGELESAFGGSSIKKKMAKEAMESALGAFILLLPGGILGIVSLVQKRAGRGMAIAGVVISSINLLLTLGILGISLE